MTELCSLLSPNFSRFRNRSGRGTQAEKVCAVVLRADGQRLADVLQGPDPLAQVGARQLK